MPNDITYEITEEKNLIPASGGLTEEDLNTWKEENFGSGTYKTEGYINVPGCISFEKRTEKDGLHMTTYSGMLVKKSNFMQFQVFNETDKDIELVCIMIDSITTSDEYSIIKMSCPANSNPGAFSSNTGTLVIAFWSAE